MLAKHLLDAHLHLDESWFHLAAEKEMAYSLEAFLIFYGGFSILLTKTKEAESFLMNFHVLACRNNEKNDFAF